MIEVGQKVVIDPFAGIKLHGINNAPTNVPGVVVYVHKQHRWFTVEYDREHKMRVSFKFSDIGDTVRIVN
jgi:hypothetical protein